MHPQQFCNWILLGRVLAADVDASRLRLAKDMGADLIINNAKENLKEVCTATLLYFVSSN